MAAFQVVDPGTGDGVVLLANAQSIPYEVFGKVDMIGFGALDQILGRQPDGTLEHMYPVLDVFLIILLVVMLRGHVALARRVRRREAAAHHGWIRRLATIGFHGYLDIIVPLLLLVRVPDAMSASWPVLVRTDIGVVIAVLIAIRLSGGGLRLAGWWRSRGRPGPSMSRPAAPDPL